MTRDEVVFLARIIVNGFPNFKPNNLSETVDVWTVLLDQENAEDMVNAVKYYIHTRGSAFPPSVSELIDIAYRLKAPEEMSEIEAWSMVRKAIEDSSYHAEERFAELPEGIKAAVGSPGMLRAWARSDLESLDSVIGSNFQRNYRAALSRQREKTRFPEKFRIATGQQAALEDTICSA